MFQMRSGLWIVLALLCVTVSIAVAIAFIAKGEEPRGVAVLLGGGFSFIGLAFEKRR